MSNKLEIAPIEERNRYLVWEVILLKSGTSGEKKAGMSGCSLIKSVAVERAHKEKTPFVC